MYKRGLKLGSLGPELVSTIESPKGSWLISPACDRSLSLPLGVGEALPRSHHSASFDFVPEMGEGGPAGFATGAQGGSEMVLLCA